nr:hypothetical protein [uncultured Rhodoferax sp.]
MSKKLSAKEEQHYAPKAIPQTCGVCRNCVPVMGDVLMYKNPKSFTEGTHMVSTQTSQKCGIGNFAVKKMGTCSMWLPLLPDNVAAQREPKAIRCSGLLNRFRQNLGELTANAFCKPFMVAAVSSRSVGDPPHSFQAPG